jgi:tRNA modification GTPase
MNAQGVTNPSTAYVCRLTPNGVGAIATLAVAGPGAWSAVRSLFQGSAPLPERPIVGRVWHGWLGAEVRDEVTITLDPVRSIEWIEVHCHGGNQVVQMLMETFQQRGFAVVDWSELYLSTVRSRLQAQAEIELSRALTLRTADVLLWQVRGALERALVELAAVFDAGDLSTFRYLLERLQKRTRLGRHLTEPWRIVLAGAPNAGKSSLMNALAGFQRSIVAPTAGTTRDVVTTLLAFDGWPATAADTAGLRVGEDDLEQAGVERAEREIARADLCLWVLDGSTEPYWPGTPGGRVIYVINKTDLPAAWDIDSVEGALRISALTGTGMAELSQAIGAALIAEAPVAGDAVPFTPGLCDSVDSAWIHLQTGADQQARAILGEKLTGEKLHETLQDS